MSWPGWFAARFRAKSCGRSHGLDSRVVSKSLAEDMQESLLKIMNALMVAYYGSWQSFPLSICKSFHPFLGYIQYQIHYSFYNLALVCSALLLCVLADLPVLCEFVSPISTLASSQSGVPIISTRPRTLLLTVAPSRLFLPSRRL